MISRGYFVIYGNRFVGGIRYAFVYGIENSANERVFYVVRRFRYGFASDFDIMRGSVVNALVRGCYYIDYGSGSNGKRRGIYAYRVVFVCRGAVNRVFSYVNHVIRSRIRKVKGSGFIISSFFKIYVGVYRNGASGKDGGRTL